MLIFCLLLNLPFSSATTTTTNAADTTTSAAATNAANCDLPGLARKPCGVDVSDEATCRAQGCSCWTEESPYSSCFLNWDQYPVSKSTADTTTTSADITTSEAD